MTRYELLDRIGVGGMAEIFRGKAVAAGGFEKPVAIKRILPHLSQDKRFVELLIAEAKVLSLLKHRNIVQIFDVGLGDDGQYFLVMEFVDGKDLGAIQRSLETMRRRIPFDLVLHMGAEICEALEHAHSARAPDGKSMSLVHRDVSPSNVLLSRAGEVKLTDFGIAKRAESEATGHGAVRGKFAYISPEQARNEHLDPRSDVFSVGILLWELITNRRLFSGLGDIEALRAVREGQVPRPRDFDGRLSAEVDALLMSALSREARNRPTAGQLGAKLRSLRYALEVTVGDPASELAKIIDSPDDLERQSIPKMPSASMEFELSEATVIRIHTADEFSLHLAGGEDVARAREVIDRFEEEETRQAQLSRDQLAFLRANALRDSGELPSASETALPSATQPALPALSRSSLPGVPTRASDEMTHAREPLSHDSLSHEPLSDDSLSGEPHAHDDAPTYLPEGLELSAPFESEATRTLGERRTPPPEPARMLGGRRTPAPEPRKRLGTQPPPIPVAPQPRLRSPTPGGLVDRTPPPGTIHDRNPRGAPLAMPPSAHPPPPQLQPMPQLPSQPPPPVLQPMPSPASPAVIVPSPPTMPQLHSLAAVHQQQPQMRAPSPLPPQQQLPPSQLPPAPPLPPPPQLQQLPQAYDRPATHRPATHRPAPSRAQTRSRRAPPLSPWILLGAIVMALLAFTVTRACLHTTAKPPAVEDR